MKVSKTELEGVLLIEPPVFEDLRGYFFESYSHARFTQAVFPTEFVQDNESRSCYGTIRGLHYQLPPFAQSKLVRAVTGTVLDVVVDLRYESPTFGRHLAIELSGENRMQLFVPRGFAHGFAVLSQEAVFLYKCDNYYAPGSERFVAYDDPQLGIDWKIPPEQQILSDKDLRSPMLRDAEIFNTPTKLY